METKLWQLAAGIFLVCLFPAAGFSQESASTDAPASIVDLKDKKPALEYPVAGDTKKLIVTGYHLRRIELINSVGESMYTWSPRKKQPYGKVTMRIGNMPGDIYNVKVEYADKKTSTFTIRNDGQVF